MLVHELRKVLREMDKVAACKPVGSDAYAILQNGNNNIKSELSEAARQLEDWGRQLAARHELQRLFADALPSDDYMRLMWWQEQICFYENLGKQIEAYFTEDHEGYLSTSLTALELLFLVRLCVEEGILRADALQTVFKFIATYLRTEKHGNLSADSLKKRYSLRHDGSRKKVKQLLMNLIRRIDQGPPRG